MNISQGHRFEQILMNELRLTHEQRLVLQSKQLQLRLWLLEVLRKEKYTPVAGCPVCGFSLNHLQIMHGFNNDVNDVTTGCPKCKARFRPALIYKGTAVSVELTFYCPAQTLDRIGIHVSRSPDDFCQKDASLYRSAITHFGTLRAAFAKISMRYEFDEVTEWKTKVQPFLGKMPDTVIADFCGAPVSAVSKLRKFLGIQKYSVCSALMENE